MNIEKIHWPTDGTFATITLCNGDYHVNIPSGPQVPPSVPRFPFCPPSPCPLLPPGQTSCLVRTSDPRCLPGPIDRCWMHSLRWRASASRVFASRNRNCNGGWNRNPNRSRADPRQQPLSVDLHGFTGKVYVALGRPKRLAGGWIR
jgi:hypothetical protein